MAVSLQLLAAENVHDRAPTPPAASGIDSVSPLRTDSRQLVSKIYWRLSANNAIMREPEWREPTGFCLVCIRGSGNIPVDVNRRIIQSYRYSRGSVVSALPVWFRLRRLRVASITD
jgi:hypothetical protein